MVSPPDAEPVSADKTLVATASDTNGPPSIDSTHSRTIAKAGIAATTAPKPTRLATLSAGNTAAFAPASMLERSAGSRRKLMAINVAIAAANAVTTAQTPPTAASEVSPQRSSAKNDRSNRGRTTNDISRLTPTTTSERQDRQPQLAAALRSARHA